MTIILDELTWVIDFFINKIPKPLQIIIFLIFILLFGVVLSYSLHIFGIHCAETNKGIKPVKNDFVDIGTNFQILRIVIAGEDLNENFSVSDLLGISGFETTSCSQYLIQSDEEDEDCFEFCDDSTDSDCEWYYGFADCFNCIETEILYCDYGFKKDKCQGNVTNIDWSWYQTWFSCPIECKIPQGYYFDTVSGLFICNETYCLDNSTESDLGKRLNALLDGVGAELIYVKDIDNIDQMVKFSCDSEFNPTITFYSINIFDYRIWVFMFVIFFMAMFLFKLKKS